MSFTLSVAAYVTTKNVHQEGSRSTGNRHILSNGLAMTQPQGPPRLAVSGNLRIGSRGTVSTRGDRSCILLLSTPEAKALRPHRSGTLHVKVTLRHDLHRNHRDQGNLSPHFRSNNSRINRSRQHIHGGRINPTLAVSMVSRIKRG